MPTPVDSVVALAQAPPQQSPFAGMGLILAMVVFIFVFTRSSQKREKAKKAELLDNLAKNDRVLTIGGVIGTIVNVKDHEVTLKIDEATNTRMTFIKRSIQQVIKNDDDLKGD